MYIPARKTDYTKLSTYKIQAKYIGKIYRLKLNEVDFTFKIVEMRKTKQVFFNSFDADISDSIRQDIHMLEREDRERTKHYSNMMEHIVLLCSSDSDNKTKYVIERLNHARTGTQ